MKKIDLFLDLVAVANSLGLTHEATMYENGFMTVAVVNDDCDLVEITARIKDAEELAKEEAAKAALEIGKE